MWTCPLPLPLPLPLSLLCVCVCVYAACCMSTSVVHDAASPNLCARRAPVPLPYMQRSVLTDHTTVLADTCPAYAMERNLLPVLIAYVVFRRT